MGRHRIQRKLEKLMCQSNLFDPFPNPTDPFILPPLICIHIVQL